MQNQGARDALTDVPGLHVGHSQRTDEGWLTGTTVVLAPEGAVAAVDSRGGGPGTRETDALEPRNAVERINAVVLSGGSAFGLDAASGVAEWLEEQGLGVQVGPEPGQVVPVVPSAILFDLGRGGGWRNRPDRSMGRAAAQSAGESPAGAPVEQGCVGAGTGAVAGGLKGGVGTASAVMDSGATVAALSVVNAAGSPIDPSTGALYGELLGSQALFGRAPHLPSADEHAEAVMLLTEAAEETSRRTGGPVRPVLNTTLAVVATDACLDKAQAQKLAGVAHDGMARAVRPIHLTYDGDSVFALATCQRSLKEEEFNTVLAAGADVLTRAMVKAVLAAEGVDGPGGVFPAYRDLYGR
ncbi:P1 family peptidase [Streptomyces xiaopingdaonensis]|uniref:P1 family peptidase n=1 Tax=Streptomyces xiaopingdaonensis TaxID=1565415 RepID=UPI000309F939|nr:P1 family peptidase [Streptomyces xiaopingdaonensis]